MPSQGTQAAFDVAVVGAGAAGQMAAIAAAEEGRRVVLLEQMDRPGLKVLASGNGRCNLTSMVGPEDFYAAFGRRGRFTVAALEVMGPDALRRFMERLGVPTAVCGDGNVYPASQRAADVQAGLARRVQRLGVTVCLNCAADRLRIQAGRVAGVETPQRSFAADRVVLACGGKSWPKLGGTGGGYPLARQAGHTLNEPVPSLVPLITRERWPAQLAGVRIENAGLHIALPGCSKRDLIGDVLMTHRGVSGPAVLNISGRVSQLLREGPVPLEIRPVAGVDAAQWARRLDEWRGLRGRRTLAGLLRQYLPSSLCEVLCGLAGVDKETTAAHLPAGQREAVAGLLGALRLTVTGTEGFDTAFVTRGGVKLKEVDPNTLASRLLPGLYVTGEMLDLDGPCGGFNLQWAFASGWLAGKCAAGAPA